MIDYRRFQAGAIVAIQPPPLPNASAVSHDFRVTEVRIAQAVLQPVGAPPWTLTAGIPVVARFHAGGRDRTIEALVTGVSGDGALTVRLPDLPDHRQQRRAAVDLPALVEPVGRGGPVPAEACRTIDVAVGGAALRTSSSLHAGEPVFLCVSLPGDDEPVVALARVVGGSEETDDGFLTRVVFSMIADEMRGRLLLYAVKPG